MRTNFKLVLLMLLLGLLLACAGGRLCQARPVNHGQTGGAVRHPTQVRFRSSRKDHPARRPFAPCSQAAIPPAEDDDESGQTRPEAHNLSQSGGATEGALSLSSACSVSPSQSMPDQPLYRTLCVLLI
jgi:hypothetical protein